MDAVTRRLFLEILGYVGVGAIVGPTAEWPPEDVILQPGRYFVQMDRRMMVTVSREQLPDHVGIGIIDVAQDTIYGSSWEPVPGALECVVKGEHVTIPLAPPMLTIDRHGIHVNRQLTTDK